MIDAIIVDDEFGARQTLQGMLDLYIKDIRVLGTASSAADARKLIAEAKPKLVFLDIKMPHESGFDLLESIGTQTFHVIFTTAYNNFALRAIKFSALDYLVKPINIDELKQAILKLPKGEINVDQYKVLDAHFENKYDQRIVLPFRDGFKVINIKEIIRFEASRNYSWVHFMNREKLLVSKTLKEYEELLVHHSFFRVHQSHLINLNCVSLYNKGRGGTVELIDGSVVEIARTRKQEFLEHFNGKND